MPIVLALLSLCVFCAIVPEPASAQRGNGYEVIDDRIVVEGAGHWSDWSLPLHAVEVTPDGVAPHLFRLRYNLLDDRHSFARILPGRAVR